MKATCLLLRSIRSVMLSHQVLLTFVYATVSRPLASPFRLFSLIKARPGMVLRSANIPWRIVSSHFLTSLTCSEVFLRKQHLSLISSPTTIRCFLNSHWPLRNSINWLFQSEFPRRLISSLRPGRFRKCFSPVCFEGRC